MQFLLLLSTLTIAAAFIAPRARVHLTPLAAVNRDFNVLDFFVAALQPLTESIDKTRLVKNPRKWYKQNTASSWRAQDLMNEFSAKYVGEVQLNRYVAPSRESLNRNELFAPFNPEANFLHVIQKYMADGIVAAVSPLDTPIHKENLVAAPRRYFKPVTMSKLRKTLARDRYYFQH